MEVRKYETMIVKSIATMHPYDYIDYDNHDGVSKRIVDMILAKVAYVKELCPLGRIEEIVRFMTDNDNAMFSEDEAIVNAYYQLGLDGCVRWYEDKNYIVLRSPIFHSKSKNDEFLVTLIKKEIVTLYEVIQ